MAFDANFPVTNSTPWSTLYAGLRANFIAIDAQFNPDASWTIVSSFGTNWVAENQVAYKKDNFSRVSLRGGFVTSLGQPGTTIFQLNSGYRPIATIYFPQYWSDSASRWRSFYIDTSGYVGYASPVVFDYGHFDGVSFYVGA
jgi:hypothetical protein